MKNGLTVRELYLKYSSIECCSGDLLDSYQAEQYHPTFHQECRLSMHIGTSMRWVFMDNHSSKLPASIQSPADPRLSLPV